MPVLTCPCGEAIDLSPLPNPYGFKLLSETSKETLLETLVQMHVEATSGREFGRKAWTAFADHALAIFQVYECPGCGRLAVFRRASDAVPMAWYRREVALTGRSDTLASAVGDAQSDEENKAGST